MAEENHGNVKIERPPNRLAEKVPKTGGKTVQQAVADADRAIQRLSKDYDRHLADDMVALENYMAAVKKAPTTANLKTLFRLVHNIRGQAATFGFPLITEVGRSLCLYLLETEDESEVNVALIEQHVNALRVIYREKIEGQGDRLSREVVDALMKAVETQTSRHQ
ncbi:Hpt domain-containing protein [Hwanghaeella grinnelliae]|uniref:Hpt domain-containing protein n=1 Tax=Hwanghaeella grinnelliae TaxID=2500179 RepID=A0A437QPZ9_9PROT|nr:Hpt domain-containing protein [Hwanghaeella grinnelliae]RVU36621.1 Hpt domain-containing protein [Hwanghaeella grinnelliae]